MRVTRLSVLLVAGALTLAGCGSSTPSSSASSSTTSAASSAATGDSSTPSSAPVSQSETSSVGTSAPVESSSKPPQPSKEYAFGASVIGTAFPAVVSFINGLQGRSDQLGARLTVADGGAKAAKQVNDVRDFTARKVDGIVINPLDGTSIEAPVKAAVAAGIPVVSFGKVGTAECAYPGTVANIEYDEQGWATKLGELTKKLLPDGGNVAIIGGLPGLAATKIRDEVYKEVVATQPNIKIVADQPGDYAAEKARSAMENILQANPDIDVVYAQDDTMAVAAVQAIKAAGRLDTIKVLGIGGSKAAMESIKAGEMTATVWSSLELAGQQAIDLLVAYKEGNTATDQCIRLPQVLVDSSNIAEYADKGQF